MIWSAPRSAHDDNCTACSDPTCRCRCPECTRARAAGPVLLAALKREHERRGNESIVNCDVCALLERIESGS